VRLSGVRTQDRRDRRVEIDIHLLPGTHTAKGIGLRRRVIVVGRPKASRSSRGCARGRTPTKETFARSVSRGG
jgi:hypothetical protein